LSKAQPDYLVIASKARQLRVTSWSLRAKRGNPELHLRHCEQSAAIKSYIIVIASKARQLRVTSSSLRAKRGNPELHLRHCEQSAAIKSYIIVIASKAQ